MTPIGFIGLGLMGAGFTRRLIATGHAVAGYDPDRRAWREAAKHGVQTAASAAEVAKAADIILVCVINTAAVEDATLGPRGVMAAGDIAGKVVVDHSTTEIKATLRIAERTAGARRARSSTRRSPAGRARPRPARSPSWRAAATAAIARIAPVMAQLGQMTHMGGVGAGQATKLVNQTLVLTNYCVLAEALRLGEAYGVDTARSRRRWRPAMPARTCCRSRFPRMVAGDFAPRGYARQVLKDLEMLQAAAPRRASRDADGGAGAHALPPARGERPQRARCQRGGRALSEDDGMSRSGPNKCPLPATADIQHSRLWANLRKPPCFLMLAGSSRLDCVRACGIYFMAPPAKR